MTEEDLKGICRGDRIEALIDMRALDPVVEHAITQAELMLEEVVAASSRDENTSAKSSRSKSKK